MKRFLLAGAWVCLGLTIAGCGGETGSSHPPPPPVTAVPEDATGHYCGMFLFEHKGPKGQILLRDHEAPVWFTTIREVFAYTHLPEEPRAIAATYVQDMARIRPDHSFPADAWINAHTAWYLIKSQYIGGMGIYDALPFSDADAARPYQQTYGGEIVAFRDVPQDYIFGAGDTLPELPPDARPPVGAAQ
ncbi:MAG: nitrous oxide reductase accessory protein NosL [Burkholderiaceae bacterium]